MATESQVYAALKKNAMRASFYMHILAQPLPRGSAAGLLMGKFENPWFSKSF